MKKKRFFVEPRRTQARTLHCSAYDPWEMSVLSRVREYPTALKIARSLAENYTWQYVNAVLDNLGRLGLLYSTHGISPRHWCLTPAGVEVLNTLPNNGLQQILET